MRDRPLAIPEKRVRRPDLADHQVVEPQDLDGALEFQALVDPRLTEEHVHGVFLGGSWSGLLFFVFLGTLQPPFSTAGAAPAPVTAVSTTPRENGRWVCEP